MPIIKATPDTDKTSIRIRIAKSVEQEIRAYMEWVKIKKIDSFLEQAAEYVFASDKAWRIKKKRQEEGLAVKSTQTKGKDDSQDHQQNA